MTDRDRNPLELARRIGIEPALRQLLVGEPMSHISNAVTLGFGTEEPAPTRWNPERMAGEFAVHTEARWRILGPDGIVTGQSDIYYTAGEPEWDDEGDKTQKHNRFRERVVPIRELAKAGRLVVTKVHVGCGAIRLDFTERYRIEAMHCDSIDKETWRMFRPAIDENHLVLDPNGIRDKL